MQMPFLVLVTAGAVFGIVPLDGFASTQSSPSEQCGRPKKRDFTSLDDAPGRVIATRLEQSSIESFRYCEVTGYVAPNVRDAALRARADQCSAVIPGS